jgi:hypothetical protein
LARQFGQLNALDLMLGKKMTNFKVQMTKEAQNPKAKHPGEQHKNDGFRLGHWDFIWHLGFVI